MSLGRPADEVTSIHIRTHDSPPGRMTFNIAGAKYVVLNDGSVSIVSSKDVANKSSSTACAIPISLEVCDYRYRTDIRQLNII
jgi:hypothetical protein